MTSAHFLFIPALFLLGFLFGGLLAMHRSSSLQTQAGGAASGRPMRISRRLLGAAFLLFVAVFVATHILPTFGGVKALHHAMAGAPIFDQKPSFSSAEVQQRLAGYGESGRALYQRFTYSVDVIFPLTLLAFLALLARFVVERRSLSTAQALAMQTLPPIWFAADMLENSIIYRLLTQFPSEPVSLGQALAWVTVTKFALLLLCLAAPTLLLVLGARLDPRYFSSSGISR